MCKVNVLNTDKSSLILIVFYNNIGDLIIDQTNYNDDSTEIFIT